MRAVRPNLPPNEIDEKPDLGGIEITSILHLNARLELREIQEISSIDRQVFDLLLSKNSLHARLLSVHW